MITTTLFWIVGIFVTILIAESLFSLVFGRKWSASRTLYPRRDQPAIFQHAQHQKSRLLYGEEYHHFRIQEDWIASSLGQYRLFTYVSGMKCDPFLQKVTISRLFVFEIGACCFGNQVAI